MLATLTMRPKRCRLHRRQHRARAMHRAHQIEIERLAPGLEARFLERGRDDAAGIVDEQLDRARFVDGRVHGDSTASRLVTSSTITRAPRNRIGGGLELLLGCGPPIVTRHPACSERLGDARGRCRCPPPVTKACLPLQCHASPLLCRAKIV